MSEIPIPPVGSIGWIDLTVPDAPQLRDFYAAVTGWRSNDVSMGDYADYSMTAEDGMPVAGVCHARGPNAHLPPQWMIYITVADLDASIAEVRERGGALIGTIREMGGMGRYVAIQDPAGAVCSLFEPARE